MLAYYEIKSFYSKPKSELGLFWYIENILNDYTIPIQNIDSKKLFKFYSDAIMILYEIDPNDIQYELLIPIESAGILVSIAVDIVNYISASEQEKLAVKLLHVHKKFASSGIRANMNDIGKEILSRILHQLERYVLSDPEKIYNMHKDNIKKYNEIKLNVLRDIRNSPFRENSNFILNIESVFKKYEPSQKNIPRIKNIKDIFPEIPAHINLINKFINSTGNTYKLATAIISSLSDYFSDIDKTDINELLSHLKNKHNLYVKSTYF